MMFIPPSVCGHGSTGSSGWMAMMMAPQPQGQWVSALERSRDAAVARSSEFTWRLWRLYMAGCAYYFDEGSIAVHQVLAGLRHQATAVPLRRDDLYRS